LSDILARTLGISKTQRSKGVAGKTRTKGKRDKKFFPQKQKEEQDWNLLL